MEAKASPTFVECARCLLAADALSHIVFYAPCAIFATSVCVVRGGSDDQMCVVPMEDLVSFAAVCCKLAGSVGGAGAAVRTREEEFIMRSEKVIFEAR